MSQADFWHKQSSKNAYSKEHNSFLQTKLAKQNPDGIIILELQKKSPSVADRKPLY